MVTSKIVLRAHTVLFALALVLISVSALASAKYVFTVTAQSVSNFHDPFVAEMVLSDAAVEAGVATNEEIESITITAGPALPEANPLTFANKHTAFVNLNVTLSEDRNTVTSLSAELTPYMSPIDYWVLYQSHPAHPELSIIENIGYIGTDYLTIETMLYPIPPAHHRTTFYGQWERQIECWICEIFDDYILGCFPWCPWPWLIILTVILAAVAIRQIRLRARHNRMMQ